MMLGAILLAAPAAATAQEICGVPTQTVYATSDAIVTVPGHWECFDRAECVPGHYETRWQKVERPGHYQLVCRVVYDGCGVARRVNEQVWVPGRCVEEAVQVWVPPTTRIVRDRRWVPAVTTCAPAPVCVAAPAPVFVAAPVGRIDLGFGFRHGGFRLSLGACGR
jgi:hypothetical protein